MYVTNLCVYSFYMHKNITVRTITSIQLYCVLWLTAVDIMVVVAVVDVVVTGVVTVGGHMPPAPPTHMITTCTDHPRGTCATGMMTT